MLVSDDFSNSRPENHNVYYSVKGILWVWWFVVGFFVCLLFAYEEIFVSNAGGHVWFCSANTNTFSYSGLIGFVPKSHKHKLGAASTDKAESSWKKEFPS